MFLYQIEIILLGVSFLLISYLIYCVFQGIIWKFCFNLKKKEKYLPYIKKFFLVNLFWMPFFLLYFLLNFLFSYLDLIGQKFNIEGVFVMGKLTNIFLAVIMYFAFISYVMIDKEKTWKSIKRSFRIGFRIRTVLMYLLLAIGFLLLNYIVVVSGSITEWYVILIGVILVMPFMIYSRIFMKEVVSHD